jgi:hypothetical protein
VFRDSVWFRQVQVPSRSATDNGRSEQTTHSYEVEAYDGVTHSERSSPVASATTPACRVGGGSEGWTLLGSVPGPTDFVNRGVAVGGNLAIVTGVGDGSWLKTIDLSDPSSPRVLGSLAAPAGTGGDVAFDGSFAYAAILTANGVELAIVDVREPSRPTLAARLPIPGSPSGLGLDVVGSNAFVAATDAGLQIVDVSDPFAPRVIGSARVDGKPKDVTVEQGYAYVAASQNLVTVDVRNPSRPLVVGSKPRTDAKRAKADGGKLVVLNGGRFTIWDASTPGSLRGLSTTRHVGATDLDLEGNLLSIATDSLIDRDRNGVHFYDISDPAKPELLAHAVTPGPVRSVWQEGNFVFAGDTVSTFDVIELGF